MKKTKDVGQITPEEKEMLRRLMETPGIEKEWDFFEGMSPNIPPPEFFMRGKPEPRFKRTRRVLAVCACIAVFLTCSTILATFMVPDEVSADKTPFEILISNIKNGFVSFKPEIEGQEPAAIETVIEGNEDEAIKKALRAVPAMLSPTYITEGYDFKNIKILEREDGSSQVTFFYNNKNDNLIRIQQTFTNGETGSAFGNMVEEGLEKNNDVLLFQEDKINQKRILTTWKNSNFFITIHGNISKEELGAIYDGLK